MNILLKPLKLVAAETLFSVVVTHDMALLANIAFQLYISLLRNLNCG